MRKFLCPTIAVLCIAVRQTVGTTGKPGTVRGRCHVRRWWHRQIVDDYEREE